MVPNSILAPLNGTPGVVSRVSIDTIYNLVSLKVGSYKKAVRVKRLGPRKAGQWTERRDITKWCLMKDNSYSFDVYIGRTVA